MARLERLAGAGVEPGRLGIEAHAQEQPLVEMVEHRTRVAVMLAQSVDERLERVPGLGQGCRAEEDLGRKVERDLADDSRAVLGQHPAGDPDLEPAGRPVHVEHVDDVAEAVAMLAQARVAVDVDPPVEHILADEAVRSDSQQLDQPSRGLGVMIGRRIADLELHQANRNWWAMAAPSALLSRTNCWSHSWSPRWNRASMLSLSIAVSRWRASRSASPWRPVRAPNSASSSTVSAAQKWSERGSSRRRTRRSA